MNSTEKTNYASLVPKYRFSDELGQQEEELETNPAPPAEASSSQGAIRRPAPSDIPLRQP